MSKREMRCPHQDKVSDCPECMAVLNQDNPGGSDELDLAKRLGIVWRPATKQFLLETKLPKDDQWHTHDITPVIEEFQQILAHHKPQPTGSEYRDKSGRYDYSNMELMCTCGHTLGVHAAERGDLGKRPCFRDDAHNADPVRYPTEEDCDCANFKKSKPQPTADAGELREQLRALRFKTMASVGVVNEDGKRMDMYGLNELGIHKIEQLFQHQADQLRRECEAEVRRSEPEQIREALLRFYVATHPGSNYEAVRREYFGIAPPGSDKYTVISNVLYTQVETALARSLTNQPTPQENT